MVKKNISDLIIEMHQLASQTPEKDLAMRIRYLADDLAKIGNEQHDRQLPIRESIKYEGDCI